MADYIAGLIANSTDDNGRVNYREVADIVIANGRADEVIGLVSEDIDVRKVQHQLKTRQFYSNPDQHELSQYVQSKYGNYPLEYDYRDSLPDPTLANSMTSSVLSNVFKVKYNQIDKVLFEGYDGVYSQTAIENAYYDYDDFELIKSDDPFSLFIERYSNELSLYDLLAKLDRVYIRSNGDTADVLVVKYLTVAENAKSDQISQDQIQELITDVRDINSELTDSNKGRVNRVMIVSFNRLSSSANVTISNMSYYTERRKSTVIEHRIAYELFYHNQLIYNVLKSTFVPRHERLSDGEVLELFSRTGWTRDTLQGISYQDPIVIYQGFKVDDVIRIYRKSHVNTEIARYSVAYRVVRSTPLFISIDDIKQNRFIDMLTE